MKIVPHQRKSTNAKYTSRAGLTAFAQFMSKLNLTEQCEQLFPVRGSNRGYRASEYINTFVMLFIEGGRCIEDVRHLHTERALMSLLGIKRIPKGDALGRWLRRMGRGGLGRKLIERINAKVLKITLGDCREVTLDIDATAVICDKKHAKRTYLGKRGYMPMVGHIAETGQVAATDFRRGNRSPNYDNLGFIKRCMRALPSGVKVTRVRIDAAGWSKKVIGYCQDHGIGYAIRAKSCKDIRITIASSRESHWQPLRQRDGTLSKKESTMRMLHVMGGVEDAFTLVIQRRLKDRVDDGKAVQQRLPMLCDVDDQTIDCDRYVYRAIATNLDVLDGFDDSDVVHWYNQRGEASENRIRDMKQDFASGRMPCTDHQANGLWFALSALAYNLFVLFRFTLPQEFESAQASTVRYRLFGICARITRHARQMVLKMQHDHRILLDRVIGGIDRLLPVA